LTGVERSKRERGRGGEWERGRIYEIGGFLLPLSPSPTLPL